MFIFLFMKKLSFHFLLSHVRKVRMNIYTENKVTRIYNVIGKIRGALEPGTS